MAYESGISPNSPELDKVLSGLEKCNPDELKVVQAAVARMLALIEQPPPYGGCVQ